MAALSVTVTVLFRGATVYKCSAFKMYEHVCNVMLRAGRFAPVGSGVKNLSNLSWSGPNIRCRRKRKKQELPNKSLQLAQNK